MKNRKHLPSVLCFVFLTACCTTALAQSTENQIAAVTGMGSSVRFDVAGPHAAVTLTVSTPDGQVFTKEFTGGAVPEFHLVDAKGERLPNGQYIYELRVTPIIGADVKGKLKAAREKGNSDEVQRDLKKRGSLPSRAPVQSGSFAVVDGVLIVAGTSSEGARPGRAALDQPAATPASSAPAAVSAAAPATGRTNYKIQRHHPRFMFFDQVIPDDLIVQGSICAGLDCINNENFGFDTIRVKENNTRIQFDDTSSTAGFATNNWQLRANNSASGGASFFAIVDQGATGNSETGTIVFEVDAGAPANSLRISSTGNVGIGTATPVLDLHANTTDTPAIRLEQNNSGGFTAQTWDIGANEANFFVRDVTGGSRLSFRIRPGAPTSSIDIAANGNVGIGTGSPRARIDLKQLEDTFVGSLQLRRATTNDTWAVATGVDNNLYFGYANDASLADSTADFGVVPVIITTTGRMGINTLVPDQRLSVNGDASKVGGGSWQTFSDKRLKNISGPFRSGLNAVMRLQPLRYQYKPDNAVGINDNVEHIGLAAQDVQKVIPEAVTANSNGYLMVNNDPIIWTMLNAIKEQQQEIQELKREVRRLRANTARRQRRR
ncbi:MAG TPA: tail fiber domain-containing protein [Pyrinomonadaceae bacterium]|nr:tail fiber domain-containing protein [Pyrinomonadaceae bacterium]